VPNTTKTTVFSTTSTSSLQLTLHQQAREQSITSQPSHDVSGRSDTPRTSNQPLRITTVAPTQVYGSRCIASRHVPLEAMKTTWARHHSCGSTISQQSALPHGQLCLNFSRPTTRRPTIVLAILTTSPEYG
jgi:hypothetical protein